jgi:DNA repair exonuclease SbcCD nuclease subunit
VLHTNLAGMSDHANYAPCSLQTLSKGYQYWALGHVHNRQILCADPYVVFPGNIQGRHGREQGEKSCELVTVADTGMISIMPISTSMVPWMETHIDASNCQISDEVYDQVRTTLGGLVLQAKDRVIAVRVKLFGATDAHTELNRDPDQVRNEVISIANECGNGQLWIERVQVATAPLFDRKVLINREDPIGEITRIVAALRNNPESVSDFNSIQELRKRLPADIAEGAEPIELDTGTLIAALEEAENLLLARLSALEAQ